MNKKLKDTTEYINYCIRQGIADENIFKNLTDEELVKWANKVRDLEE